MFYIEQLKRHPADFLWGPCGSTYTWPESAPSLLCENMFFVLPGGPGTLQAAYAHDLILAVDHLRVGHFATAPEFMRMGVGRAIALWLALEIHERYDFSEVLFAERTQREANEPFFRSLGALAEEEPYAISPSWRWRPSEAQLEEARQLRLRYEISP